MDVETLYHKRGFWLSAFIIVATLLNLIDLQMGLDPEARVLFKQMGNPAWCINFYAAVLVIDLLSLVAITLWSKSGVVLYVVATWALTVAQIVARTHADLSQTNWMAVGGTIILIIIIRAHWRVMTWGLKAYARQPQSDR